MRFVIDEFNKRAGEVELYYAFIHNLIEGRASLCIEGRLEPKTEEVSSDIHRILKANMFLLLYNLVESSFKEALTSLSEQINTSALRYEDSIPEIRKLWIECEKDYFSKKPNDTKKLEYFYKTIETIREGTLSVPSTLKGIDISGNVDARKIKECMSRYGIDSSETQCAGDKLRTVKNKRNNLAHGESSFVECGRDIVLSELKEYKNDVIEFMREILSLLQKKCEGKYFEKRSNSIIIQPPIC